jgi:hypothetical protein
MIPWFDSTVAGLVVVTLFLAGGAAALMGQALASTWRPAWQGGLYGCLLGAADRFLNFALFDGLLLSATGFVLDTLFILAAAGIAYRVTQVRLMVRQYPWLYVPAGLFAWRRKDFA